MKVFVPLVLRMALIASIATWTLCLVVFWLKGLGPSPLHCLILGAMVFVLMLPTAVQKFVRRKWFPLALSMWMLVMIPTALFAFNASAGLGDKFAHLYIPLGVFGCVFILAVWAMISIRDRRRSERQLARKKWSLLAISIGLLAIIPTILFAFDAATGRGNKGASLYLALGVFGCVAFLGFWGVTTLVHSVRAETPDTRR